MKNIIENEKFSNQVAKIEKIANLKASIEKIENTWAIAGDPEGFSEFGAPVIAKLKKMMWDLEAQETT